MAALESIRHTITVEAEIETAFTTFTSHIDRWWPARNSITQAAQASVTIEPCVGGRWYEESVDGEQCEWGKVLVWDPPRRLVLAWQLDAAVAETTASDSCHEFWRYEPSLVTEVELRFTVESAGSTRVELEHRHLDRFRYPTSARLRLDSDGGWPGMLDRCAMESTVNARS